MTLDERKAVVREQLKTNRLSESNDPVALVKVTEEMTSVEALPLLRRALAITPAGRNRQLILCRMANAYRNVGEFDLSWNCSEEARALDPKNTDVLLDRSFGLLLQRDYESGLRDFDLRIEKPGYTQQLVNTELWDGSVTGAKVVVTCEQGHGDQIQMIRFLAKQPLLNNELTVECHIGLERLFSRLTHLHRVVPYQADSPLNEDEFDFHLPFMSVARVSKADYSSELYYEPYLVTDPALLDKWKESLSNPLHKVGIVWRGNSNQPRDCYRSIPLEKLSPLLQVSGVKFYSLTVEKSGQQELDDSEQARDKIEDLAGELTDFDQTAAVISNLDLVISVDTAVAHLAGALGKEVWVPLSRSLEWRWGFEGEQTHWYPSMTLVRQTYLNDWKPVVDKLKTMLEARIGGHTHEQ